EDGQLARRRFGLILRPVAQQAGDCGDVCGTAWRPDGLLRLLQRQVIDEAQAVSPAKGPDLVLAIRIEGSVVEEKTAVAARAELDRLLLPLVPDHELAPHVGGRQDYDQGRNHPVQLLAVTVGQEEAAPLVQEQAVEMALQFLALESQPLLDRL